MTALRLHLCMAVTRPHFLPIIMQGLLVDMEPHPFELRWHLAVQGPEPDPKGSRKFNEMVDAVPSGWLYLMSDDTVPYPRFFRVLGETIEKNPNAGVIVVGQVRPIGTSIGATATYGGRELLHARKESVYPGAICGGQVVYERSLLGLRRYDHEHHLAASDGVLVSEMFRDHPERFVFVDQTLTRFNSLEWLTP